MSAEGPRRFSPPNILRRVRQSFRQDAEIMAASEIESTTPLTENQRRINEAKRILNNEKKHVQRFFGPNEVEKAFGISLSPDQIPLLDITPAMLDFIKAHGRLILRIDKSADGSPLTIERMEEVLQPEFSARNLGRVLANDSHFPRQRFFTEATPRTGWFFVSGDTIEGTDHRTYLDQSNKIGDFLVGNKKILGNQIPLDAIRYLSLQNAEFHALVNEDPEQAVGLLSYFSLNQAIRPTPVEAVYDLLVPFLNTGVRLLPKKTSLVGGANAFKRGFSHFIHGNRFIGVGPFNANGIRITEHNANSTNSKRGAVIAFPIPKPTSDLAQ
jgi:hypothetical protein